MNLTTKQKQHLKGLAHSLKPVVLLGGNVKVASADRELKNAIVDAIVRETQSTKVQLIGHVLVIFRHSAEMKIALPKAK